MSRTFALAGREFRAFFFTPVGFIVIALFLLMAGIVFVVRSFEEGEPATLRPVFEWGTWMLVFVCPAITMRAISEERRLGTFEMLMSSPINEMHVVLGKFAAALGFLFMMLAPVAVQVLALETYGRPDYGEVSCGFLGMVLAGSAFLASGILASSLTTSQVVAFLLTFFFWAVLSVATKLLPPYLPEPWTTAVFAADPDTRLHDFAIGLIDSSHVVYFLSLTVLFLVAAMKSLQWERLR